MSKFQNPDLPFLSPKALRQLITGLLDKLRDKYIFPDVAEQIDDSLRERLDKGTYNDISDGASLAFSLTYHLQQVSKDEHLWVRYYPDPLPEHHGSLLQNEEKVAQIIARAREKNFGIQRAELLPEGIGLLEIHYFYRPEWGSREPVVEAMRRLADASALIIDLRKCQGGNPHAVAFLSSYLFKPEPVLLNTLYWRDEDRTEEYWTMADIPGPRLVKQPVYVLLSKKTFSAGEEFAYNLQALKRATLIGETTSGGAHPGSPFRLHPHFEVFIPMGRAVNPVTGTNWEGVGVKPDIEVLADQALETACRLLQEHL